MLDRQFLVKFIGGKHMFLGIPGIVLSPSVLDYT